MGVPIATNLVPNHGEVSDNGHLSAASNRSTQKMIMIACVARDRSNSVRLEQELVLGPFPVLALKKRRPTQNTGVVLVRVESRFLVRRRGMGRFQEREWE